MKFFEIDDNNNLEIIFLGEFDTKEDVFCDGDFHNENNIFINEEIIELKNKIINLKEKYNNNNELTPYFGLKYETKEMIELGYFLTQSDFYKMYIDDHWCLDISFSGSLNEMELLIENIDNIVKKHIITNEEIEQFDNYLSSFGNELKNIN